jgi:uncharacterized protein YdeI (YjbR/CyaY-like superfamily)
MAATRWTSTSNSTPSLARGACPPDLAEALDRAVDARRFLDRLSYSNKRRFVMGIEDARTEETRQRRGTADNVTEQTQPM